MPPTALASAEAVTVLRTVVATAMAPVARAVTEEARVTCVLLVRSVNAKAPVAVTLPSLVFSYWLYFASLRYFCDCVPPDGCAEPLAEAPASALRMFVPSAVAEIVWPARPAAPVTETAVVLFTTATATDAPDAAGLALEACATAFSLTLPDAARLSAPAAVICAVPPTEIVATLVETRIEANASRLPAILVGVVRLEVSVVAAPEDTATSPKVEVTVVAPFIATVDSTSEVSSPETADVATVTAAEAVAPMLTLPEPESVAPDNVMPARAAGRLTPAETEAVVVAAAVSVIAPPLMVAAFTVIETALVLNSPLLCSASKETSPAVPPVMAVARSWAPEPSVMLGAVSVILPDLAPALRVSITPEPSTSMLVSACRLTLVPGVTMLAMLPLVPMVMVAGSISSVPPVPETLERSAFTCAILALRLADSSAFPPLPDPLADAVTLAPVAVVRSRPAMTRTCPPLLPPAPFADKTARAPSVTSWPDVMVIAPACAPVARLVASVPLMAALPSATISRSPPEEVIAAPGTMPLVLTVATNRAF